MIKKTNAHLLLPHKELSNLIFAAIIRDTRGLNLNDIDRYNFFPATPFYTITWVIEGELFNVIENENTTKQAFPKIFINGPKPYPRISWSAGDICAITLCFFPDAWQKLTNMHPEEVTSNFTPIDKIEDKNLALLFGRMLEFDDNNIIFETLQKELIPYWKEQRQDGGKSINYIKDWAAHIFAKTAVSHAGKSVRQIQRHIKNLTGQTRRDIENFIKLEELFAKAINSYPDNSLADLSFYSGFSDQSHMGRMVKKMLGKSPAAIDELIATDERYWVYRLLAQIF